MRTSDTITKDQFSFIHGPILLQKIMEEIEPYHNEKQTGAYSIFLGQVRNDVIDDKEVRAISYTTYQTMVFKKFQSISQQLFTTYDISDLRILHSLDEVPCGGVSLMVIATAPHRIAAMEACRDAVDLIKSELPIWGKELFVEGGHVWKVRH